MAQLKMVYMFSDDSEALSAQLAAEKRELKYLLGGKGANLAIMTSISIPVPPGFTVTTDACNAFQALGRKFPEGLECEIDAAVAKLEAETGKKFGDPANPLLVSVRSGARASMPGMMDTVLNLGMNDDVAEAMVRLTGNERFVFDAYRRFIMMYGDVVMGVEREYFEHCFTEQKKKEGVTADTDVSAAGLRAVVAAEQAVYKEHVGAEFPGDARLQLMGSIRAVFDSWENDRAIAYRQFNKIPHDWGTAVNVQTMVFGNMGDDSGTGVAFTRDPGTGEKKMFGDYLQNAQGEDVVAGIRTPMDIEELEKLNAEAYAQFLGICDILEAHYHDMQDVEFTIERGKLWMLQCRNGKRTAAAAVKIAVDLFDEGLLDERGAVKLVPPEQLDQLLHPQFDASKRPKSIATGVAASPGAAAGRVVFSAAEAVAQAEQGNRVVLVRHETSPDDIRGMAAAQGILTQFGGKTSHAAVVGRQMGKPCVVGCSAIELSYGQKQFSAGATVVKEGEFISIDGGTGEVMLGDVELGDSEIVSVRKGALDAADAPLYQYYSRIMEWADQIRTIGVRTNADTPEDSALAIALGAEGIGLTRTEHMFFGEERIRNFQIMVLAENTAEREAAAANLLPFQREDFYGILKAMDGKPVIIRLLDPPLHEFLPKTPEGQQVVADMVGKSQKEIADIVDSLHETNPMLGHRGCRLGVTFPEIYKMQVRAIFEAACQLKKEGFNPIPEVMIPVVALAKELEICRGYTEEVAKAVIAETGVEVEAMIGTMIELPRACVTADEIARFADFFSFGTNDLTQTVFGFSRDDVEGKFIPAYVSQRILQVSPFESIDVEGVGALLKTGVEKGRQTNPKLEVGICGEHGGDPHSVVFCHKVGLDYVSCSPLRVPIARLAAAQAQIDSPR